MKEEEPGKPKVLVAKKNCKWCYGRGWVTCVYGKNMEKKVKVQCRCVRVLEGAEDGGKDHSGGN